MNRFLPEIHEKYTKIVKSANLIGFLNRLVSFTLFAYFGQNCKNFNQIVNTLTFTVYCMELHISRIFERKTIERKSYLQAALKPFSVEVLT